MAKKPIRKTMRRRVSDPVRTKKAKTWTATRERDGSIAMKLSRRSARPAEIKRTRMAEGNRSAIIEARVQQALSELPSQVQGNIEAMLTNSCLLFIRNAGARYGDHVDSSVGRALIAAHWALMTDQAMTAAIARVEQKASGK